MINGLLQPCDNVLKGIIYCRGIARIPERSAAGPTNSRLQPWRFDALFQRTQYLHACQDQEPQDGCHFGHCLFSVLGAILLSQVRACNHLLFLTNCSHHPHTVSLHKSLVGKVVRLGSNLSRLPPPLRASFVFGPFRVYYTVRQHSYTSLL